MNWNKNLVLAPPPPLLLAAALPHHPAHHVQGGGARGGRRVERPHHSLPLLLLLFLVHRRGVGGLPLLALLLLDLLQPWRKLAQVPCSHTIQNCQRILSVSEKNENILGKMLFSCCIFTWATSPLIFLSLFLLLVLLLPASLKNEVLIVTKIVL